MSALSIATMAESNLHLQGMAYVPGVAHGVLHRGVARPNVIALIGRMEAVDPTARPAALIVVDEAPLSHRMISLAARGIPTVLISAAQAKLLEPGTEVWVDGAAGQIVASIGEVPTATRSPPIPEAGHPVYLADGTAVWLMASIRGTQGARQAIASGAAGIGLMRSEFLGDELSQPPDTAYFTRELETLCDLTAPHMGITVRLLDLAADKPPHWLPDARHLLRPLGMQGARLFTREPVGSVLRAQLAAVAALSDRFDLAILIPYLGTREELIHWAGFVRQSLPQGVPIGAMAETPAAVLDLANWCDAADFFTVGCNDLMQCLFGADRDEPELRSCLDPYAPVLYRLLGQAADAAGEYQDRVRLCGVLPRLAGVLPVLVGLGFRRFSVDPTWIPYLADGLHLFTVADAQELAYRVRTCRESREVSELLGLPPEANPAQQPS